MSSLPLTDLLTTHRTDWLVLLLQAVHSLCEDLRPDTIALTDAFDFPDRVLNSALGRADGNGKKKNKKLAGRLVARSTTAPPLPG